jgi:hypothetical protein
MLVKDDDEMFGLRLTIAKINPPWQSLFGGPRPARFFCGQKAPGGLSLAE